MSNFMSAIKNTLDSTPAVTENGAVGYRSTGRKLLDLNFAVASLRSASEREIADRFIAAFFEDKGVAMKWLFFARDIRGGLGERRLFRSVIEVMAKEHPEYIRAVIKLVPEYGRWDDLWCLLDTSVADEVFLLVASQLHQDVADAKEGKSISLLAKWMPRRKSSSKQTSRYASMMCSALNMTEREYQHTLSGLSAHLKVVEQQMSARQWDEIEYQRVPSRANLRYNSAFLRHDEDRRREFLARVERGEAKINAGTLFPHDIVHQYSRKSDVDATLETLWKSLPDTVQGCGNTIVVADGSGSMSVRIGGTDVSALEVANSLAIYFAERSSGQFKDNYITFSETPKLVDLSQGKNLREKLSIARRHCEVANTNIEAVFNLILNTAIQNKMRQEELPQNILIISDMEFDSCATWGTRSRYSYGYTRPDATLFGVIAKRYQDAGYQLPRLVFWNVNSRTGTIPIKENDLGVALVSGFSPNIAKMVMSGKLDPYECLLETLNSERYQPVEDALHTLI